MSTRLTLLFVCDDPAACSAFHDYLRLRGFRVVVACDIEGSVLCSYTEPVDCVLIYQNDIRLGSIIGCDMKPLFPTTPVVLISTGIAMIVPPAGIEAVCYSDALDEEMADVIAMLYCDLLIKRPDAMNHDLEHDNKRLRPVIVRRL